MPPSEKSPQATALNLGHFVNGAAKRHGEGSQLMFKKYLIESITNCVHAVIKSMNGKIRMA